MKKYLFLILTVIVSFNACNNDPIFYLISLEEKILEPRIKGSPTNFVELSGKMYVGSGGAIYEYNNAGGWSEPRIVGGHINSLAVANNYIYALCGEAGSKTLKRSLNGINWSDVSTSVYNIETIYSTNNILFAGANLGSPNSILSYDGTSWTFLCNTVNNLLNGAAFDGTNYYFSTNGAIYRTNTPATPYSAVQTGINNQFMGIINTKDYRVFAISRNGNLYPNGGGSSVASFGNDHKANGALAVYNTNLLLAGRQNQYEMPGYSDGYLELDIGGGTTSGGFHEPGTGGATTLEPGDSNETYSSTIGKRVVNHLYQALDGTLFASTQKDGVWSYRIRRDKWQWNAEE